MAMEKATDTIGTFDHFISSEGHGRAIRETSPGTLQMTGCCDDSLDVNLTLLHKSTFVSAFEEPRTCPFPPNLAQPFAPDNLDVSVEGMRHVCLVG